MTDTPMQPIEPQKPEALQPKSIWDDEAIFEQENSGLVEQSEAKRQIDESLKKVADEIGKEKKL